VAIETLGWFIAGAVGALPYLVSGSIDNFTDAYFESVSGFTTTGASILSDIEKLPKGILMWRSIIQWLGGMGIIVLSIASFLLGIGGMQLTSGSTESVVDKLSRGSHTAKVLGRFTSAHGSPDSSSPGRRHVPLRLGVPRLLHYADLRVFPEKQEHCSL
jgi:trk system potassium uptake protein TrkH